MALMPETMFLGPVHGILIDHRTTSGSPASVRATTICYVADAGNGRIRILNRSTLEIAGSIGRWGRQAGQ